MEVEISQALGQIALQICEDYKILTPRAHMAFEFVDLFQSPMYEIYLESKCGRGPENHIRALKFLIPGA